MLISKIKAGYVGNYHFNSKGKEEMYYVLQFLYHGQTEEEKFKGINKATIIQVFTDVDTYQNICELDFGTEVELTASASLESGKIYYKVG